MNYDVFIASDNTGNFSAQLTEFTTSDTNVTFTDAPYLNPLTTYYTKVVAKDSGNIEITNSGWVSFTTTA